MGKEVKRNFLASKHFVLLVFILSALIIYFTSINAPLHFDDIANIMHPDVTIKELSYESLKKAAFANVSGLRPVAYLTFAINYYISGNNTTSSHVVNIAIHVINAFLIYLIILHILNYKSAKREQKNKIAVSAFFTALVWLCTPLNSQAVIFIVQRMTLLMTLFFLLAFYSYLKSMEKNKILYSILSIIFYLLSVLSKQSGVIFPLTIIAYKLIFIHKGNLKTITKNEKIIMAVSFLLLMGTLFFFKDAIYKSIIGGYQGRSFTMYERLLTQLRVIVFYFSLLVFPLPSRLSITHDFIRSTSFISPLTTLFSLIFLIILIVFAILRTKKSPYFTFAVAWFFIATSVESSVLPLELVYEHRMYLPIIFLIGTFITFIVNRFYDKNFKVVTASFCSIVILLGIMTGIRGVVWRSDLTLWQDVVKKYPEDARAQYNIGVIYYEQQDYDKAIDQFIIALKSDPFNPEIFFAMGNIYASRGIYDYAERCFTMTIECDNEDDKACPKSSDALYIRALNNLGCIYLKTSRYEEAQATFKKVVALFPEDGVVHYNIGQVLKKQNKYDDAANEFQMALDYDYPVPEDYVEMIRCTLLAKGIQVAESLYKKYEDHLEKLCIHEFVKGLLAEQKGEFEIAKTNYISYLYCKETAFKLNPLEQELDPYPEEAYNKLRQLNSTSK